ncbi:tetratricopeptide repeat protein, partial [bacterium]|nr:tetratricopeptide repeat protein [candidate division CSSED10-310 bacterium]
KSKTILNRYPLELAKFYFNKAVIYIQMNQFDDAIKLCRKAVREAEVLIERFPQQDLTDKLSRFYSNLASTYFKIGSMNDALLYYQKAEELMEGKSTESTRISFKNDLAMIYTNKAVVLRYLEDFTEALRLYDKAIAIREYLVHEQGFTAYQDVLAKSYLNKAYCLKEIGYSAEAFSLFDTVYQIRERLLSEHHRIDIIPELVNVCHAKVEALCMDTSLNRIIGIIEATIETINNHADGSNRKIYEIYIAELILTKAEILKKSNKNAEANRNLIKATDLLCSIDETDDPQIMKNRLLDRIAQLKKQISLD